MPVHDLSSQQLEKLVKRLGATADAYKEAGLYPPPQVISELRRAQQLYEQKKIPPKPNVQKQYNHVIECMNDFGEYFADYMDGEITPSAYLQKLEVFRDVLRDMKETVDALEAWKIQYEGRE